MTQPSLNALVRALKGEVNGLPSTITFPRRMAKRRREGVARPGRGFLGKKYNPWLLTCDPADAKFTVPGCELPEDLSQMRLDRRLSFLGQINRRLDQFERDDALRGYGQQADQAIELLSGGKARAAFDLNREPAQVRDRYGRTTWGQSVLLAGDSSNPAFRWCKSIGQRSMASRTAAAGIRTTSTTNFLKTR